MVTTKEVREMLEVVSPLPYADQIVRLRALVLRNRDLALAVQDALDHCRIRQVVLRTNGKFFFDHVLIYKISGVTHLDDPTTGQCYLGGKYYNVVHVRDNYWKIR